MLKNKYIKYLIELFFLFFVITITANIISIYRSANLNKEQLQATSFILSDGLKYITEENKPLIVHFWATWCPICRAELSNIEFISKHYQVLTVAVNSGSNNEMAEYAKKHKLNFKIINDSDGVMAKKFNISMFPTTIIYNKNKNIAFIDTGYTSTLGILSKVWWAEKFN
ncbi:redoxin domain-containing protein [Sulfurimonas sp.]|uniref:redoxin domain-containing protein n=1 Tax=Sulfurimonas sp. TaxID=2022749 RepID=UPI0025E8601E|nr:redoxin domain-containing protein [Sulfurimonas sp.]MDD5158316.1 redoxin domain-containing protein [Sulfurimonas sp.]